MTNQVLLCNTLAGVAIVIAPGAAALCLTGALFATRRRRA
jgi:hypothetical protein